jgi:hypothetical protein
MMEWVFNYKKGDPLPAAQNMTAHCVDDATGTIEQPPMQITLRTSQPWLHLTPSQGLTPLAMQVSVNPIPLADGAHTANVELVSTADPVVNPNFSVPVTVNVTGTPIAPPPSGTVLLVDFGSPHIFGLPDWSVVIKDQYTDYRPIGPGGMTIIVGSNYSYNYQGVVGGLQREFHAGDVIRATWYNASSAPITFTPKIGFTLGRPDNSWLLMTTITIQPQSLAISEYTFTDATAGLKGLISVAVNYTNNQQLIADKIEWIPFAITPPPQPQTVTLSALRMTTLDGSIFEVTATESTITVKKV